MNTMTTSKTLSVFSGDNLSAYLQNIANIPVLSAEEEMALAMDYQNNNSLEAAQKLVLSNLKFVVHIVKGYSGYGLNQMDLIQEGNIGLMRAVKKFDPNRKVKLISFAVHWIRAAIHEFVIRNWRMVKIATTKEQRKLFFNLRKNKKHLGRMSQAETKTMAKKLNVSTESVTEMEKRLGVNECAFDLPDSKNGDKSFSPSDYLQADNTSLELLADNSTNKVQNDIKQSLLVLDGRSREIIQQRWLKEPKATLHDLAIQYNISMERVRQIEQMAMKKMKQTLLA